MRTTLNNRAEIEPHKNLPHVIAAMVNKKKSMSTYNCKNLQSHSTSALPPANFVQ